MIPPAGPIRLLIVDDHPVVRDGLRGLFADDPDFQVVGEAANGAEAVARVERLGADVVLMDLRMPEMAAWRRSHGLSGLLAGSVHDEVTLFGKRGPRATATQASRRALPRGSAIGPTWTRTIGNLAPPSVGVVRFAESASERPQQVGPFGYEARATGHPRRR